MTIDEYGWCQGSADFEGGVGECPGGVEWAEAGSSEDLEDDFYGGYVSEDLWLRVVVVGFLVVYCAISACIFTFEFWLTLSLVYVLHLLFTRNAFASTVNRAASFVKTGN